MTIGYRGTIKNGVVVFDPPASFAEGTVVRVEAVNGDAAVAARRPGAPHFCPVGAWDGPPGELDQLLKEVQSSRDADVRTERDAWE